MAIRDRLTELRRERGYSQEQLANQLHVSRQAVSKWEAGTSMPELEKIIQIADLFDVSVDYLVREGSEWRFEEKEKPVGGEGQEEVLLRLDNIEKGIRGSDCFEYKSKKRIKGIPLVHVKISNKGNSVAIGVIAIGNISIGIISVGGIALGAFSFGGIGLGILLSLAGLSLGMLSFGGVSVGILSVGAVCVGQYAIGAVASASKIAAGSVASGHIAIGKVIDGARKLWIDNTTKEQIKAAILEEYPKINQGILYLFSLFGK